MNIKCPMCKKKMEKWQQIFKDGETTYIYICEDCGTMHAVVRKAQEDKA